MELRDRLRIYSGRLGRIAFAWAVVCAVFSVGLALGMFGYLLYYIVLGAIIILTLGAVFALVSDFGSLFSFGGEGFSAYMQFAANVLPYTAVAAVALAVVAIVLTMFDLPERRSKSIIIVSVAFVVITLIILLDALGGHA